jgi:hypothetical protein
MQIGGVILVVAAAAVGVLFATGVLNLSSGSASSTAATSPTSDPLANRTPVADTEPVRPLSTSAPLRLWIAGDSLAGSLGPSLGDITAKTGVVQPVFDSRVSSGLTNPDFFDWPKHAAQEIQRLHPEVVVFVVGTNDANTWDSSQTAQYALRTEQMMALLAEGKRPVYWVVPPPMRDDRLEKNALEVAAVQRAQAKKFPSVTIVDAHALFADAEGKYESTLVTPAGKTIDARAGDGVHFSADGADYLAAKIYAELDAVWGITAQAVPSQPKDVIETEGSTQVAGTHRSTGSDNNSSDSSSEGSDHHDSSDQGSTSNDVPTTTAASPPPAPTTSPPTTSPPASTPPTTSSAQKSP